MRFILHGFRWVMLVLYALLLLGFWMLGLASSDDEAFFWCLAITAFTLGTQALFIFCAGTRDLIKPVHKKRRLFWPVAVAAFFLMLLVVSFALAMTEVFKLTWGGGGNAEAVIFWVGVAVLWIGWGVFFFVHTRHMERFKVLKRLTTILLAGSLAELLACIPAHIVVSRRPGCLVGLLTGSAVVAGIYVMLWSFGPGIVLLFLRPKREAEAARAAEGTVEKPAPRATSFSLMSLLAFMLFVASCMAVVLVPQDNGFSNLERPEFWLAAGFGLFFLWRVLRHVREWETRP